MILVTGVKNLKIHFESQKNIILDNLDEEIKLLIMQYILMNSCDLEVINTILYHLQFPK